MASLHKLIQGNVHKYLTLFTFGFGATCEMFDLDLHPGKEMAIHSRITSHSLLRVVPLRPHSLRQWRVLINPGTYPKNPEDTRFSHGLESVRNDAKYLFGQLKVSFLRKGKRR